MSSDTVTAVIPAHPPRMVDGSLRRAIESILNQDHPVDAITIAIDPDGRGAADTRHRALMMATTRWVAFCDADDWWHPNHIRTVLGAANDHDADYAHSWWSGNQVFPEHTHRGRRMGNPADHHTTMNVLVRTDLARDIGFQPHPDAVGEGAEDWLFTVRCVEAGAKFVSVPDITWHYTADGHNTSGLASRWSPTPGQGFVDVTALIPHIPTRRTQLLTALDSIWAQTTLPLAVAVAVDHHHTGAAATRTRALMMANTAHIAPLDDDDEWLPNHLTELAWCHQATGADIVYTGPIVQGLDGVEVPLREEWGRYGQPFDPDLLRTRPYLPVTCWAPTNLAKRVGGYQIPAGFIYDDYGFYLAMLDAGATFVHHPVRSWVWHHTGYGTPGTPGNTSGQPDRW